LLRNFKGKSSKSANQKRLSPEFVEIVKEIKVNNEMMLHNEEMFDMRRRLVDWMLVVIKRTGLSDQCYFFAVDIFDDLLHQLQNGTSAENLHVYAVCCLILASKYEEEKFIDLDYAVENICHSKFTKEEIKNAELFILKTLKFKLKRNFFEDFSHEIIRLVVKMNSTTQLMGPNVLDILFKTVNFTYKLLLQEDQLWTGIDKITFYFAILHHCLSNGFKDIKTKELTFQSFKFFEIAEKLGINMREIFTLSKSINEIFVNFLENPKKSSS